MLLIEKKTAKKSEKKPNAESLLFKCKLSLSQAELIAMPLKYMKEMVCPSKFKQRTARHKKSPYLESFWSVFFTHFPAFGLNTEIYAISLRIQSKCGKMREKCGLE